MFRAILSFINKLLPKYNHIIVQGFPNVESSAVEMANHLALNYKLPIYFLVSKQISDYPVKGILHPKIQILERSGFTYWRKYLTAKYLFFTHGSPLDYFSRNQTAVNIWHGIFYKNIGTLSGHEGLPADLTVATSKLTQHMFAEAFAVPQKSVVISGYPRNDILIKSKLDRERIKNKIGEDIQGFTNVIIWLPTYRKSVFGDIRVDGKDVDNPFCIENFDTGKFQDILKKHNTLCLVKPHPMAPKFKPGENYENLKFIDDQWISSKGITLYHLAGCSDLLISDVSSIIIDYILIDQPIICISTDLENYKNTRGFYFEDIEQWIPTRVNQNQEDYFELLDLILATGNDPYEEKRRNLKEEFFTFSDAESCRRICEAVFGNDKTFHKKNYNL